MLTVAQVGLSRLAILLFVLGVFHAEGHSLLQPEKFNGHGYFYACPCSTFPLRGSIFPARWLLSSQTGTASLFASNASVARKCS